MRARDYDTDLYPLQTVTERLTPKPLLISGGLTDDGLAVETSVAAQFRVPLDADVDAVRDTVESHLDVAGTVESNITWRDAIPPSSSTVGVRSRPRSVEPFDGTTARPGSSSRPERAT